MVRLSRVAWPKVATLWPPKWSAENDMPGKPTPKQAKRIRVHVSLSARALATLRRMAAREGASLSFVIETAIRDAQKAMR